MNKSILIFILVIAAGVVAFFLLPTQVEDEPTTNELSENDIQGLDISDNPSSGLLVGSDAIYAADQKPADAVSVSMVVLKETGYVVIHEDNEGAPGAILGASEVLSQGQSEGVSVALSRASQNGEALYAMLHTDNGDDIFNPADDGPVKDEQDNIIMMRFNISSTAEGSGPAIL